MVTRIALTEALSRKTKTRRRSGLAAWRQKARRPNISSFGSTKTTVHSASVIKRSQSFQF